MELVVEDGDYTGGVLTDYDRIIFNRKADSVDIQGIESPNAYLWFDSGENLDNPLPDGESFYDYPMGIYTLSPTYKIHGNVHVNSATLLAPGVVDGNFVVEGSVSEEQMENWVSPKSEYSKVIGAVYFGGLRWVSEKWTSRNKLGDNYVLGGIHYETSTSTVHCRVQKERCQSCC